MSALLGTSADWYLMRASGFVALILLTVTVALGVANVARLARGGWTPAVAAFVHRNASLLAVVFLAIHILTAITDKYVTVSAWAVVLPGASGYDPLWVGLGAVSVDLMLAITITSLLRGRLGRRTWQAVHWLAYLSWPTALIHAIGSGSGSGADTGATWSTAVYVACGLVFVTAVATRLWWRGHPPISRDTRPAYAPPAAGSAPLTGLPATRPAPARRPAPVGAAHLSRRTS